MGQTKLLHFPPQRRYQRTFAPHLLTSSPHHLLHPNHLFTSSLLHQLLHRETHSRGESPFPNSSVNACSSLLKNVRLAPTHQPQLYTPLLPLKEETRAQRRQTQEKETMKRKIRRRAENHLTPSPPPAKLVNNKHNGKPKGKPND